MAQFTMGNLHKALNASDDTKHRNMTLKNKKPDKRNVESESLINKNKQ